jgi:protein-disulfide isomerase
VKKSGCRYRGLPGTLVLGLAVLTLAASLPSASPRAQTAATQGTVGSADEAGTAAAKTLSEAEREFARQIKEEIMRDLRESGFLQEQIELGIQEFIRKQRETQAKAQEEQQRQAQVRAKNVRRVSADRDHIFGNPDAPVSLIEYSDFECPYCKRFHATARKAVDEYQGKVNWVYRHFPLSFHNPGAQKQAEAAECAAELGGNDGFWAYTDALYERTKSGGRGFPLSALVPLAEELGMDGAEFRACLDSGRHTARVQEDLQEGSRIGVTGTPGNVLLNNETGEVHMMPGALPYERLSAQLEKLLP